MSAKRYLGLPFQSIGMLGGQKIIRLQNVYGMGDQWPSLEIANHNVFRLDAAGNVVWQVQRVELPQRASWDVLHRMARERDPSVEGYYDQFWDMHLDEHLAQDPEPHGVYRPGCKISLRTERVWFDLDVETGIAVAKGHEFK